VDMSINLKSNYLFASISQKTEFPHKIFYHTTTTVMAASYYHV
jgi:hypothetical protein